MSLQIPEDLLFCHLICTQNPYRAAAGLCCVACTHTGCHPKGPGQTWDVGTTRSSAKCLQLDGGNPRYVYRSGELIESSLAKKDLGFWWTRKLNLSQQCVLMAQKGRRLAHCKLLQGKASKWRGRDRMAKGRGRSRPDCGNRKLVLDFSDFPSPHSIQIKIIRTEVWVHWVKDGDVC